MIRGIIWIPSEKYQEGFEELCSIIDKYERYSNIKRINKRGKTGRSKDTAFVSFENGDYWKLVKVENGRGYRCNISYIHHDINQENIDNRIEPATNLPPYNAIRYFGHYSDLMTEELKEENRNWAEKIWNGE